MDSARAAAGDRSTGVRAVAALAAVAAALLSPWVFRALLVAERTGGLAGTDLRGSVSDLGVSLLALAAIVPLTRRSPALGSGLLAVWCVGQYANYEVVSALGSLASLSDAHFLAQPAFLFGSGLAISRPVVLVALIAASLALGAFAAPRLPARSAVLAALAGSLVLGALSLWPWRYELAAWRQTHFVQRDVSQLAHHLVASPGDATRFRDAPTAMLDLLPSLASDLDGTPRFRWEGQKRNVLLVILESVSGLHMRSLAQDHGVEVDPLMPELDAIARESLSYSSFFVHQRRTNKGLYAILCGELPSLVDALPKMSAYTEGGRVCLPEALAEAGYHTVYLQTAPLAFMLKDRFMPRAGFEESYGDEEFEGGYARTAWGLDDRAFFEQSLARIRTLQAGDRPWFLTLLTVGTHHPYVVPDGYRPEMASEIGRALRYADEAVAAFDRALDELGVPEDTLVIYTSDEAVGFDGAIKKLDQMIVKGWGFLIVRSPEDFRDRVREPFAQMDLATSILDYLGLTDRGRHFFGRSVFRRYDRPRHIFFSNSNSDFNAVLHPDGHLAVCMLDFESCRSYAVPSGHTFGPRRRRIAWDPEVDGILEEMGRRSVSHAGGEPDSREFALMLNPRIVVDRAIPTVIHGGQYVSLEPGDWIEIELVVEARGDGVAEFSHHLQYPPEQHPYGERVELPSGSSLDWHYSFAPSRPVPDLDARSSARIRQGTGVELHFQKARMTVHRAGRPPGPGIQVERFSVAELPPSGS